MRSRRRTTAYVLSRKLSPDVIGAWQQVSVHFDAAHEGSLAVYSTATVLNQGRSNIVPAVDRPMQLFLGVCRRA